MVIFGFCFQGINDAIEDDDAKPVKMLVYSSRLDVSKYVNSLFSIIFNLDNAFFTSCTI